MPQALERKTDAMASSPRTRGSCNLQLFTSRTTVGCRRGVSTIVLLQKYGNIGCVTLRIATKVPNRCDGGVDKEPSHSVDCARARLHTTVTLSVRCHPLFCCRHVCGNIDVHPENYHMSRQRPDHDGVPNDNLVDCVIAIVLVYHRATPFGAAPPAPQKRKIPCVTLMI
jgi:hypothetical protein